MMKAIGLKSAKGGVELLEALEVPIPELQPHDILVKMVACGMNPVDYKVRSGGSATFPIILGYDGVGTVEKLGSEASLFKVGDKVWTAGVINRNGTNSEYTAVDERIVGYAPSKISAAKAAAVPLVLLTAWEGIFEQLGLKPFDSKSNAGKSLLILPGAGGVGSFVIQLAKKLCGLIVIATASRTESGAAVKALGADIVINHRKPLKEQLEANGLSGVDYIYNAYKTDVNFDQYCEIINPLGKIVSIVECDKDLPLTKLMSKRATFSWELMFTRALYNADPIQQHYILNHGAMLVDCGLLQLPDVVIHPYSVENLRKIHEEQESGRMIGKNVLEM